MNGKRNGKGKLYDDSYGEYDKLKYEGEFLNGKKNGKGIEYDRYKYEGEFVNGKKNGKGKEYTYNSNYYYGNYGYKYNLINREQI